MRRARGRQLPDSLSVRATSGNIGNRRDEGQLEEGHLVAQNISPSRDGPHWSLPNLWVPFNHRNALQRPTEHPRMCVGGGEQAVSRWGSHGENPNSRQFSGMLWPTGRRSMLH